MKQFMAKIASMLEPVVKKLEPLVAKLAPVVKPFWERVTGVLKPVMSRLPLADWWANKRRQVVIAAGIMVALIVLAFVGKPYVSKWLPGKGPQDITETAGATVEQTADGMIPVAGGESVEITPSGQTGAEVATVGEITQTASGTTEEVTGVLQPELSSVETGSLVESSLDSSPYYWNLKLTMEELNDTIDRDPANVRAYTMLVYTHIQIADEFQKVAYQALKDLRTAYTKSRITDWLSNLFPVSQFEPQSYYLVLNQALAPVRELKTSGAPELRPMADQVLSNMDKAYDQYTCALGVLEQMQIRFDSSPWPFRVEGLLRLSLGEEMDALKRFEKGAEAFKDGECANSAGMIWMRRSELTADEAEAVMARKQAKAWFGKAIKWSPKIAQGHNNLGLIHLLESEKATAKSKPAGKKVSFSKAEKAFSKASKLHGDENNDRSRGNLAVAYYYKGKHKRFAEKEIRQAYSRNPSTGENINNLGCMEIQWGESSLARDHFKEAVNWMPGSSLVWNNYGFAHLVLGDLDQAKDIFKMAGNEPAIRLNLSFTYLKMKSKGEKVRAPMAPPVPGSIVDPTVEEL